MSRIRVLIVEDHHATREGLQASLSRDPDLEVIGTATNADDGLELIRKNAPAVVLLDLHLPGKFTPKAFVHEVCRVEGIKVIIVSSESRRAFVKVTLDLGVCAYLLKSESLSFVSQTIKDVAAGKKDILSQELMGKNGTKLTPTEEEVLQLIGRGLKYQDIAEKRYTSPNTVRKQVETLLLKLNLTTREELIAWANNNGYASLEE